MSEMELCASSNRAVYDSTQSLGSRLIQPRQSFLLLDCVQQMKLTHILLAKFAYEMCFAT